MVVQLNLTLFGVFLHLLVETFFVHLARQIVCKVRHRLQLTSVCNSMLRIVCALPIHRKGIAKKITLE